MKNLLFYLTSIIFIVLFGCGCNPECSDEGVIKKEILYQEGFSNNKYRYCTLTTLMDGSEISTEDVYGAIALDAKYSVGDTVKLRYLGRNCGWKICE